MNALFRQDRLEIIAEVSFSLNPTASAITGWALMKLRLAGKVKRLNVERRTSNIDNFVKSRIFPFFWIPAFAGMTIIQFISDRYHRRHTREGGYPVFKTTFYDSINIDDATLYLILKQSNRSLRRALRP